ncbi:MAG: type II secretion system minor pseudopilin GspJ, partial [Gammaproteobacteria bacterium]|nr:type II secretion system minor pseudopilin GspJ [Gammaproteobacteria bacterium]
DGSLIDSDSGGIAFVRAGWTNPQQMLPRSELQPVSYRIRDEVLQRVSQPFVDDASGEAQIQNLLEGVTELAVNFIFRGEEVERWELQHSLPDIVIVRLETQEFGVIERWLLVSGAKAENIP